MNVHKRRHMALRCNTDSRFFNTFDSVQKLIHVVFTREYGDDVIYPVRGDMVLGTRIIHASIADLEPPHAQSLVALSLKRSRNRQVPVELLRHLYNFIEV